MSKYDIMTAQHASSRMATDFGPRLNDAAQTVLHDNPRELADLRFQKDARAESMPALVAALQDLNQLMPSAALVDIYSTYVGVSGADQTPVIAAAAMKQVVNEGPAVMNAARPAATQRPASWAPPTPNPFKT